MRYFPSQNACLTRRGRLFRSTSPTVLAAAVVCMATVGTAHPAQGRHPEAATILDKYIEVTGGKAAYEKIHNRVSKQRLVHVEMGFEDSIVEYRAKPNKRYVIIESDAMGEVRQGTDGDVVWYVSEQTGPMIEQDEPRLAGLDGVAFDRVVHWRKYYKKAECVGEEVVEGKSCYKIVMTPNHGEPETRYYDKESNLLVKASKARLSSNMPTMRANLTNSDYKWVDGLLIAHEVKQESQMCGSTRVMLFITESIEHNVDLPPNRFDPPKTVQAFAVARKAGSFFKGLAPKGQSGGGGCCGSGEATASQGCSGQSQGESGGCCGGEVRAESGGEAQEQSGCCGGAGTIGSCQTGTSEPQKKDGGCGGL